MDQIEHKFIQVNGLKLHVAEIGNGPSVVLFLHGFPEIWYSWRHQMVAVANAGYRAIAPDYRGYGLSDPPPEPEKATFADFVSDLVPLLDAMSISKVFVVGKDFGAFIAYFLALLHQERVSAVLTLGIPFMLPGPRAHDKSLPEGFYVSRWRRTEEAFATYAALYEKSGFQTALQVPYRSFGEMRNFQDPKVEVPALLIMGEKDYVFRFPGMEDYIRSGDVKLYVPKLEIKYIPEGSHFVQEQLPDLVNELLLSFLSSHSQT